MTMLRRSLSVIARQLSFSLREIKPKRLSTLSTVNLKTNKAEPLLTYTVIRNYAKDKGKDRNKKKKIQIYDNEIEEYFEVEKLYSDFNKPLDFFKKELTEHATLRTSPGAIQSLKIKYEGDVYPIQDLAEVSLKNPKMYILDFSSFPDAVPIALEMFQKSELNLNVQQEGVRIIVPIPKVTKEHRELLVKKSKTFFLKCKDSMRKVQFDYVKKLKNINKLSEEMQFRLTEQFTALGDQYIDKAEKILKEKNDELMKTE